MFSSSELAELQAFLSSTLPHTGEIVRRTQGSDGLGGQTTISEIRIPTPCFLAPSGTTPQEREIAAKLQATSTWTITLPASTDIRLTDQIEVDGRIFEVGGSLAGRSYEVGRQVVCKEVS